MQSAALLKNIVPYAKNGILIRVSLFLSGVDIAVNIYWVFA